MFRRRDVAVLSRLLLVAFTTSCNASSAEVGAFNRVNDGDLAAAACRGDVTGIKELLKEVANPNAMSATGGSPLIAAIKCQDLAGVKTLLAAGADPNDAPSSGDWSPLMAASAFDNVEVIRALASAGADLNYVADDPVTSTPLEVALVRGIEADKWMAYETLLSLGAVINRSYGEDRTIAEEAAMLGRMDKVLELLERGYRHNLQSLASTVQARQGNEELEADKKRVLRMLNQLGAGASS
jgi:ankyrin repeat protein